MGVFDELKSVGKILQEAGKIEQYQQILDAQQKLLEMQKSVDELTVENRTLKEKLETKGGLIFERNAYWIQVGEKKDGPYCTCCWDDEKKTIRMQPCGNPAYFSCPRCKNKNVQVHEDRNSFVVSDDDNFDPYRSI